ncbi:MAG: hypothetical protein ACD_52C00300G0002 [uncultured bacterium]|uniref:Cation-transporting P-type ATPase N-terminal domain-containing protein n=1 Tax=Candidatus Woesebacteria bacterium RIFCSPHIGHO2_12_FULL_41_24 TaxID=1802510 RepID=A0A1F8ATI9_9BACT|nr:MAG: hypothetical protein ACD_52C00300G0002 [uncultured bacterium]OGM15016.1 MAG: hypothetical protein A2W15_04255 [Candidatus Woesebacteria bacterium RBG_16_41_13]OGM30015.1 MAG: hypothetical protein A2873_04805 [Candidatus Woesebacteria bacterium RIFCSPHIGHO2_01_FULL_42_80]OGM35093.1 MAG: hypothetical protein A3D84_01970 [Candidatus Woesebacteria bacterium RIFCSPHIGHO2_02_FULL_42_20]OGM54829.1 MAG: hypothetical protein A3E44_01570 [Candidatus Woesebacteria bacterium RIFCSPHIGHO2_12_FULL_41
MKDSIALSSSTKDNSKLFSYLHSSSDGLTHKEAGARLKKYGLNKIKAKEIHWYHILIRQLTSPFIYVLIIASIFTFFLGETADSVIIIGFVVINTFLGFTQEYRSHQAVKILSTYTTAHSMVIRDKKLISLPAEKLVPGDIVAIEPGDIIPADMRIITCNNLIIDESILTGESDRVSKTSEKLSGAVDQIVKAKNIAFSATSVMHGNATGIVIATAKDTAFGEIERLTTQTTHTGSFEKGIAKFSTFTLRLIVATLVILYIINLVIKGTGTDKFQLAVFSVALAVSVIPEALPLVTTFSLSRGALRLAKKHVVVKRLSSVEDLGGIEVLCTDKTGTLTENRLTLDEIHPASSSDCLKYAYWASNQPGGSGSDPFDMAIISAANKVLGGLNCPKTEKEIPFDPERRRNTLLVRYKGKYLLISRGAPDTIFKLCKLTDNKYQNWVSSKGNLGKRTIAIAHKELPGTKIDIEDQENSMEFDGVISFTDPIKPTAAAAIANAKKLGLTIKILTGDSSEVSGTVGLAIGLIKSQSQVTSGNKLEELSTNQFNEAVGRYTIFARVTPAQKHRIVEALKENHEVGFLGEGINDAPALKAANVAIIVSGASDIAKDTADIVLLHKSLRVIIEGIEEGRKIFANTTKYIQATLASNFGNFYAVAVASLLVNYLPMLPVQILLVNLLSDFPMIAIATDSVDTRELTVPNKYDLKGIALIATILGLVSSVFDFIFFAIFSQYSPETLQTMWFVGSILTELVFIYSIRTKFSFWKASRPSATLILLTFVAGIATIALPFTAFGQQAFKFARPETGFMLSVFILVLVYFLTTEFAKRIYYKFSSTD